MNLPKACPAWRQIVLGHRFKIKKCTVRSNKPVEIRDPLFLQRLFQQKIVIRREDLNWLFSRDGLNPTGENVIRRVGGRQWNANNAANLLTNRKVKLEKLIARKAIDRAVTAERLQGPYVAQYIFNRRRADASANDTRPRGAGHVFQVVVSI